MINQLERLPIDRSAPVNNRCVTVLLCLLMVAGISGTGPVRGQTTFEVDSLSVGDRAPTFVMKMNGTTDYVFLRDYAGELRQSAVFRGATQQVVILSFFASWCKPCQKEAPVLADIMRGYEGRDVQLFFVNVQDSDREAAAWLETYGVDATCLMDPFAANAKKFGVDALPRTIIIDKQGYVKLIERGFSEENEAHYRDVVTATIDELLNRGN
jgi:thiol-disulfide isomerase/thioredoxin